MLLTYIFGAYVLICTTATVTHWGRRELGSLLFPYLTTDPVQVNRYSSLVRSSGQCLIGVGCMCLCVSGGGYLAASPGVWPLGRLGSRWPSCRRWWGWGPYRPGRQPSGPTSWPSEQRGESMIGPPREWLLHKCIYMFIEVKVYWCVSVFVCVVRVCVFVTVLTLHMCLSDKGNDREKERVLHF